MNDQVIDHSTQAINVGSKSFAAAAKLFDERTRQSAVMLYAWCRHCDDVIDGQTLGHGQVEGDRSTGEARLAELVDLTERAYAGEPMQDPAFAAFQQVIQRHRIPLEYPLEHLAGFRMDVQDYRYQTLDDTLLYCYRVAGVVGLMMAKVMGAEAEATLDRACDLGLAFQLTNIARDIVEDAEIGRVYLPADWLAEVGIPAGQIGMPYNRPALALLAARLVHLAEPYYLSASQGLRDLPLRSAWSIATAHGVYRQIGVEVKARGAAAWDTRVSTTSAQKLQFLLGGGVLALASRRMQLTPRPDSLWTRPRRA
ncbi:phytoene/squalene synthase family protein [Stutzerimonas xanthomarina]|uniref:phytoene/squalene synthase family protein n=1 Tax=Stutzerimonas xanthomarina TaxID=271420 RepID=UPI0029B900DE|nr:phytoene/squalene synthase family protein [Stutzerimonas xanthomarina]MDX2351379.1 phytoene/squalene synthase family protein [Stutzerimonas xanthomarina]